MSTDPQSGPSPASPAPGAGIGEEELKRALTAFKKRLKLTRLDQESRLGGHRPTSAGKKSDIAGIVPPREFPLAVWQELARQGKVRDMGGGFYTLP